jgi:hypothetical protein
LLFRRQRKDLHYVPSHRFRVTVQALLSDTVQALLSDTGTYGTRMIKSTAERKKTA